MPVSEILYSAGQIAARVQTLAAEIDARYAGTELLLLAVLKGAAPFAADLMRHLHTPVRLDFIRARSYQGTASTGTVTITCYPEISLKDRHVLLVEDILDTGRTAAVLCAWVQSQAPASCAVCAFLDKPSRRTAPIHADFHGFTIPDLFVVGYGLDLDERYRELPDIRALPS